MYSVASIAINNIFSFCYAVCADSAPFRVIYQPAPGKLSQNIANVLSRFLACLSAFLIAPCSLGGTEQTRLLPASFFGLGAYRPKRFNRMLHGRFPAAEICISPSRVYSGNIAECRPTKYSSRRLRCAKVTDRASSLTG
jgi:hypothetical protein